jgi:uncharacterized protein (DUF433 family)
MDWSQCPDVERVADRCGGAWVVKGTRIRCQDITGQFEEGCTPEQIAGSDIYPELDVDLVRRILAFAAPGGTTAAMACPETIYMQPTCDRCKDFEAEGLWWEEEKDAACSYNDCPNKSVTYIRADLFDAQVKRMEESALDYIDETGLRIATLTYLLRKARERLDAFGDADLMEEINAAFGQGKALR